LSILKKRKKKVVKTPPEIAVENQEASDGEDNYRDSVIDASSDAASINDDEDEKEELSENALEETLKDLPPPVQVC
jgi:hypothetical protein